MGPCLLAQFASLAISLTVFVERSPEANWGGFFSVASAFFFVGVTTALLSDAMRAAQSRARSRAEEAFAERKRLRATLSCLGEGVIATDENARRACESCGRADHRLDRR
jgi:hypothetical protein